MVKVRLEEIFKADDGSLKDVSHKMILWATPLTPEQQSSHFKVFITKNIKGGVWKKSPRKAYLVFSTASDSSCKATESKRLDSSWEKDLDYLSKIICKVPTEVALITEEDIRNFIKVGYIVLLS